MVARLYRRHCRGRDMGLHTGTFQGIPRRERGHSLHNVKLDRRKRRQLGVLFDRREIHQCCRNKDELHPQNGNERRQHADSGT